jgi:predicted nuclease of predicted toxin-antitoxin system
VKLLLDFNLSPKLLQLLSGLFPGTTHAQMTELPPEAEDIAIWDYAKRENFTILTADRDFLQLAERLGQPPKLYPARKHELSHEAGGIHPAKKFHRDG